MRTIILLLRDVLATLLDEECVNEVSYDEN
jgi:hypothetical protein